MSGKRPYGIRQQDWTAMQQFEYQKKHAPAVVSVAPVKVRPACPCSFRPYPHILNEEFSRERHMRGDRQ